MGQNVQLRTKDDALNLILNVMDVFEIEYQEVERMASLHKKVKSSRLFNHVLEMQKIVTTQSKVTK